MRVAGTQSDAARSTSDSGLAFVLREWIGDPEGQGQLGYFSAKLQDKINRNRLTNALGRLSLLTSVAVVAVFVILGTRLPGEWSSPLMVAMGATLLLYGIRQGYGYATAEKDLIKQYEFMLRLFQSARRRLDATRDPEEQRPRQRVGQRQHADERHGPQRHEVVEQDEPDAPVPIEQRAPIISRSRRNQARV